MANDRSHAMEPLGWRVWLGQTQGMPRAHTHHDLELNHVIAGPVSYLVGGRTWTIPTGHLAAIWGAMPHQTLTPPQAVSLAWATIPLSVTWLHQLPQPFVESWLTHGIAIAPQPDPADLATFGRWARQWQDDTPARRELLMQEMILRVHRLALDHTASARPSAPPTSVNPHAMPPQVQAMAAYIARHYREPITLQQVAQAVHLHPNYAMTLFRRHIRMTLNTYLTRQRVAHAQRLLATGDQSILTIAFDSGFGSASRFFKAFRQHTGCSPRQYRQRLWPA